MSWTRLLQLMVFLIAALAETVQFILAQRDTDRPKCSLRMALQGQRLSPVNLSTHNEMKVNYPIDNNRNKDRNKEVLGGISKHGIQYRACE